MAGKQPSRLQSEKAHSSKPYERQKSLVQTVKELLLPSWLTSWKTPLVTEEEADALWPRDEEPVPEVAPKRARTEQPHPGYSFADPRDAREELSGVRTTYERGGASLDSMSAPHGTGDSHSERSEASGSTSGCSSLGGPERDSGVSLEPRMGRHDWSHTRDCGVMANLPASLSRTSGGNSHGECTEMSDRWRMPQQTASRGQSPGFSLSAFGMPINTRERQRLQSPFYPGQTTYGGAAAYRRFGLSTAGTPKATPVSVQLVERRRGPEEEGLPDCMSNATRQILSTLERMASPLSEAKKVPLNRGNGHTLLSYMPPSQRRRAPYLRASPVPVRGPPRGAHARPVASRLARNPDPVVSTARKAAPKVSYSPQVRKKTKEGTEEANPRRGSTSRDPGRRRRGAGGRTRRYISWHDWCSMEYALQEAPPPPDLPDVPLPVRSLPSFTFQLNAPAPAVTSVAKPMAAVAKPTVATANPTAAAVKPMVVTAKPTVAAAKPTPSAQDDFAFAPPPTLATASAVCTTPAQVGLHALPIPLSLPAPASHGEAGSGKGAGTPPGGARPATELVLGGSVMDVLGRKDKVAASDADRGSTASGAAAPVGSSKEVPRESGDKADGAEVSKPSAAPLGMFATDMVSVRPNISRWSFEAKFKPAAGSWSCSVCMINNAGSATKCAACETPKPGATPAAASATGSAQGAPKGFGDLFKPPATSWECDTCMVHNEAKASRCCACETPRVSAAPAACQGDGSSDVTRSDSAISTTGTRRHRFKWGEEPITAIAIKRPTGTFKFGAPSSTPVTGSQPSAPATFKFGNLTASSTPAATPFKFGTQEISATGTQPASQFKFGSALLACKPQGTLGQDVAKVFGQKTEEAAPKPAVSEPAATEPPKTEPTIGFGVPKTTETSTSSVGFSFCPTSVTPKPKTDAISKTSDADGGPMEATAKTSGGTRDGGLLAALAKATGELPPASSAPSLPAVPKVADPVVSGGILSKPGADSEKGGFSFNAPIKDSPTPFAFGIPSKPMDSGTLKASAETKTPASVAGFAFGAAAKTAEGSEPLKTVTGFSFGAAAPTTKSEGFAFGAATPKLASTFSFGNVGAQTTAGDGATLKPASTFSFGNAGAQATTGNPAAPKPTPTFSFGNAGAQTTAASGAAPKPAFSFGNAGTEATTGSGATPKPTSTFSFGNAGAQATPGDSAGATAPSTPKFVFGQKTDTSPGTFTFGTASLAASPPASFAFPTVSAAATQPVVSQGSFGDAKPKPATGGFKFGASQESAPFAAEAPAQPAPSSQFSFGAAAPAPAVGGKRARCCYRGGFAFGAAQSVSSQAPAFSFGGGAPAATPAPAPQVEFAAPTASPLATRPFGPPQTPAAPVFAFGTPMATPAAPQPSGFQFGGSAPNQGGVFRFGASSQSAPESGAQSQPGGFNFSAAQPAPLGAFGQQQQPGAAPGQGFNFNAAAPANPPGYPFAPGAENPFSATGTGGATPARRIRKAIRRKPNPR
ncbi:unnamed protein product [Ixodes hexagonus]